ncbi:MAG: Gfo/Idh/MocA family oxidoreductase [Hyphomonadaceae bacterium]|nr:Gfo/Idh/MocA family oxidoreductase [Hyphomonadaceae bacterium]
MAADRREVLKAIAAGAVAAGAGSQAEAQARAYRVGVVGCGWFGKLCVNALMQIAPVQVVALCDVDQHMLEEARDQTFARPDSMMRQTRPPAIYRDYRDMLNRHRFDIVIVATPDHWHTLPAIAAIDKGAHVYLEKPISVDVREGQAIVSAARRRNRVVQVGTQRRVAPFTLDAKERVIDAGLLGPVHHVEAFCYFRQRLTRVSPPSAPPANLDWDFYCGPAERIDYRAEVHPRNWRSFEPFGNGYMGDVGVHMIDLARAVLGLGWPRRVWSIGGGLMASDPAITVPDTQVAGFEYDNLLMTWTNRHWGRAPDPENPWGAAIHGADGTLRLYNTGYEFLPSDRNKARIAAELEADGEYAGDTIAPTGDMTLKILTRMNMRDFIGAIREGRRPASDIEEGHISTATCALANLSLKLGRSLAWDAGAQRIVGDDEANALLARPYRAPWIRPT